MAEDCFKRLMDAETQKKLFGDRKMPEAAIRRLVDDIESLKQAADANPELGNFNSRVREFVQEQKELLAIEKFMRTTNLRKRKEFFAHVTQEAFAKDPVEGILSVFQKSNRLANNANNYMEARQAAYDADWMNLIYGGLEEKGLLKIFVSGDLDLQIEREMDAVARGITGPSGDSPARQAAEIIHRANKVMFQDHRNAGIPIRELQGWLTTQQTDRGILAEVGQKHWVNRVMQMFMDDKAGAKKTFGVHAGNVPKMVEILESMYENIMVGRQGDSLELSGAEIEDSFKSVGHTRSLADKLAESRYLRFENPDMRHAYRTEFSGKSLAETIPGVVSAKARDLALVERFGTNPHAAFLANVDRLVSHYRKTGREDLAKKLRPQPKDPLGYNAAIMTAFNRAAGWTDSPADNGLANTGNFLRSVQSLSKLGASGIRAINNFAVQATNIKAMTGKNLLTSYRDTLVDFVKGVPPAQKKKMLRDFGYFVQDVNQATLGAGAGDVGVGIASKATAAMLKMNGLHLMTEGIKTANSRTLMTTFADESGKMFKSLDPRLQATLLGSGIDATDWTVLQKALVTEPSGRTLLTPGAIDKVDRSLLAANAAAKKMSVSRYTRNLQMSYKTMILQAGNIGSTSAGVAERNHWLFGVQSQAGTAHGEFQRLKYQFKGFALQAFNISNQILNSRPDEQRLLRGVLMSRGMDEESFVKRTVQKDFLTFAQLLVGGAALTYIADTAIRMANGKDPEDPTNPKTWANSMVKSGVGGIYADVLTTNYQKYGASVGEALAGPTIGQFIGPVFEMTSQSYDGKMTPAKFSRQATKLVRENIPFQNFPFIKQGFDYLHYDVINETLNPGSAEKRKRFERRNGG